MEWNGILGFCLACAKKNPAFFSNRGAALEILRFRVAERLKVGVLG